MAVQFGNAVPSGSAAGANDGFSGGGGAVPKTGSRNFVRVP